MKIFISIITVLAIILSSESAFSQKVFMIGDSHVAAKIYPEVVGEELQSENESVDFSYWGKNGARFDTFAHSQEYMGKIYHARPDILIVHLGTNDSYAPEFHKKWFDENLTKFYDEVMEHLPECKIIFVTPFINKLKAHKDANENTKLCAEAIVEFANAHHNCYVADNNSDYGMVFIKDPDLIQHDYVHLSPEGYEALGLQVASEIFNTGLFGN